MNATLILMCVAGAAAPGQAEDTVFSAPRIAVKRGTDPQKSYHYILYNRIYVARAYVKPRNISDRGNPKVDFSRLPTTYFHDKSPIGMVMQKDNWFPKADNLYRADARLPASMVGMALDPWGQLASLWSEPAVAVLGMDGGTLAAYARPGQTFHCTERVPAFVQLSMPNPGESRYFHFVKDALDRGANLRIFEGEPRAMIEKHGGAGFYQVIAINTYKLPVVEVHKELMTKEAVKMLVSKLRPGGILCYHTSNRYYDLAPILLSAAAELKYAAAVGHDSESWYSKPNENHRFTSDWVMIARQKGDLANLKEPPGYLSPKVSSKYPYWSFDPPIAKKVLWTDQGENSFRGVYRSDPSIDALNEQLSRAQSWIGERTSMPSYRMYQIMEPLHDAIRAWSARSARELNRDPAEKKSAPEKKGDKN